ncbi:MAG: TetR/AcrR family transcriptional regulator, partial [Burkholderiales bacterium]|nr:TetR/AcrR family transcriptional regulator [Burkholderiales bacterium]
MARPREFDEDAVLDAVVQSFWVRGYEATSMRDLIETTGLTGASLYNAFGDKRMLYQRALDHYVEGSIAARIRRCETMAPRGAIRTFFAEILKRSLTDRQHKGCMLVNAALELAPRDADFQRIVADVLVTIEAFFAATLEAGQADGTIARTAPPAQQAQHLLGVLMGVRVLARVRPEKALLENIVETAMTPLDARPGQDIQARST